LACEHIIFVHGTGATAESHEGPAWWQNEGPLWQRLIKESEGTVQPQAFIWSGENSETARRTAGKRLHKLLLRMYERGESVHLIGHSHGGSVIWHALNGALAPKTRSHVKSWASVGTPFLTYGPRLHVLGLNLFLLLLAVALLSWLASQAQGISFLFAFETSPIATVAWCVMSLIPIALVIGVAIFGVKPFITHWLDNRQSLKHVPIDPTKFFCVWSNQDEPIIGLGASGSFALQVLKQPNLPLMRLSPFSVIKHAINQYVNNLVSRYVQGSTFTALELRRVSQAPHKSLNQCPLPEFVDDRLIKLANSNSAKLASRLRDLLMSGRDPVTGLADLQSAVMGAITFKELVHTSYFGSPDCVDMLVHHVLTHCNEPKEVLKAGRLKSSYDNRSVAAESNTEALPALPSNRLGSAVATTGVAVVVLAVFYAIAQGALHQLSLTPTTISYNIAQLTDPKIISTVLRKDRRSPAFKRDDLQDYLNVVARSGQVVPIFSAAHGLSPELRHSFLQGVPSLFQKVKDADLIALLNNSEVLGFERRKLKVGDEVVTELPIVSAIIDELGSRKMLKEETFDRMLKPCGSEARCKNSRIIEIAHAYVGAYATTPPKRLLPLPRPWIGFADEPPKGETGPLDPRIFSSRAANENFLKWAASVGDWDYVAGFNGNNTKLNWNDFSDSVMKVIQDGNKEKLQTAIVALGSLWDPPPPIETIQLLAKSAGINEARLRDEYGRRSSQKEESEVILLPKRGLSWLKDPFHAALKLDSFFGANGTLKKLHMSGVTPTKSIGKLLGDEFIDEMATSLQKAICRAEEAPDDDSELMQILMNLEPPKALPPSLTSLAEKLSGAGNLCETAELPDFTKKQNALHTARFVSLALAGWLDSTHPRTSVKLLVGDITLTPDSSPEQITTSVSFRSRYAALLARKKQALAAAAILADQTIDAEKLIRRSILFTLAGCASKPENGKAISRGLKEQLVNEAMNLASIERDFGEPKNLMPIFAAEAFYFSAVGDWGGLIRVCKYCDLQAKSSYSEFALRLIGEESYLQSELEKCEAISPKQITAVLTVAPSSKQ
jgi:hypothetical protein